MEEYHRTQFSNFEEQYLSDDIYLCELANTRRQKLYSSPTQSFFRVYALLIVSIQSGTGKALKESLYLVDGANAEQGYIGGAICAERSALVKLRFLPVSTVIRKIIIVTDNNKPISPGLLCREFIFSLAQPETPIVLASSDNSIVSKFTIGSIHPYPYVYRYQNRDTLSEFALRLSHKVRPIDDTLYVGAKLLVEKATESLHLDKLTRLHPLQFAAAVLFSNGDVEVAWQLKGLEYGCTLDPVCQLIREMEKRRFCRPCVTTNIRKRKLSSDAEEQQQQPPLPVNGADTATTTTTATATTENAVTTITTTLESEHFLIAPVLLLFVDQHGVAHAPFAQARALLTEHGYGDLSVVVHDYETLQPVIVRAADLTPEPPSGGKLLCQDDF